jgi:hypothetical protein
LQLQPIRDSWRRRQKGIRGRRMRGKKKIEEREGGDEDDDDETAISSEKYPVK